MLSDANIKRIKTSKKKMAIYWSDNTQNSYSYLFLRDNCDSIQSLHSNGQKLKETHEIAEDICPSSWWLNDEGTKLSIRWKQDNHTSEFSSRWLRAHPLSKAGYESEPGHSMFIWDRNLQSDLPGKDYSLMKKSEEELASWISSIATLGFGILHNVPPEPGYILKIIRLFGFVRETNYGKIFDVKTRVDPSNMAFSNSAISPHTDNPYRHPVPTLQVLHCLRSNARGGDSILVDGFRIAEEMRKNQPAHFRRLTLVPLTYRFRDEHSWLENSAAVISLDLKMKLRAITYNNRSVCPFDLDEDEIEPFYEAYRAFGLMTTDPAFQIRFKMEPGDLYIVNNERILHARTAYEDSQGERWLQGAYADADALLSKLRLYQSNPNGSVQLHPRSE